jgi:hypothetical protein
MLGQTIMKKADVGGPDSIQCGKRLPVRVGMRGAHRVVQVFRLHANSKLLEVIARELIVLTVKQLFLNGAIPTAPPRLGMFFDIRGDSTSSICRLCRRSDVLDLLNGHMATGTSASHENPRLN